MPSLDGINKYCPSNNGKSKDFHCSDSGGVSLTRHAVKCGQEIDWEKGNIIGK